MGNAGVLGTGPHLAGLGASFELYPGRVRTQ